MSEVFISHATDDGDEIIDKIASYIEDSGLNTWVDHHNIQPSDNWQEAIQNGLKKSFCGLFVLSSKSAESDVCRDEWSHIMQTGKNLYVVMIDDIEPEKFPFRLRNIHYVDLRKSFEDGIQQIINAMKGGIRLLPDWSQPDIVTQVNTITGDIPSWHLDFVMHGRDNPLQKALESVQKAKRVTGLYGIGGTGKTRLAVEVATRVQFRDGVIWHEIDPNSTVNDLTSLIKNHLQLDPSVEEDQTWGFLATKQVLIVIDNAEDCANPAPYVEKINGLITKGGTCVLMTSRVVWDKLRGNNTIPLNQVNEHSIEILNAMLDAESPNFADSIAGYEQKIVDAARHHPGLIRYAVLSMDDYEASLVLAELENLEGKDAQQAIESFIGKMILQMRGKDNGENAYNALKRLLVFRGGFTGEAALRVGDIQERTILKTLRNHGLIQVENARYSVPALVRSVVDEDETAYDTHLCYFIEFADKHANRNIQIQIAEESNYDVAITRAIAGEKYLQALDLLDATHSFLDSRGYNIKRLEWTKQIKPEQLNNDCDKARTYYFLAICLTNQLGQQTEEDEFHAFKLLRQAEQLCTSETNAKLYIRIQWNIAFRYEQLEEKSKEKRQRKGIEILLNILNLAKGLESREQLGLVYDNLGLRYGGLSYISDSIVNRKQAIEYYHLAIQAYDEANLPFRKATILNNLAFSINRLAEIEDREKNLQQAKQLYEQSLEVNTPNNAPLNYARRQSNLAFVYMEISKIEPDKADSYLSISEDCLKESLKYRKYEIVPSSHAITSMMYGLWYLRKAYREKNIAKKQKYLQATIDKCMVYISHKEEKIGKKSSDLANAYTRIGRAYFELSKIADSGENLATAEKYINSAGEIINREDNPHRVANLLRLQGDIAEHNGDKETASKLWHDAISLYEHISYKYKIAEIRERLDELDS